MYSCFHQRVVAETYRHTTKTRPCRLSPPPLQAYPEILSHPEDGCEAGRGKRNEAAQQSREQDEHDVHVVYVLFVLSALALLRLAAKNVPAPRGTRARARRGGAGARRRGQLSSTGCQPCGRRRDSVGTSSTIVASEESGVCRYSRRTAWRPRPPSPEKRASAS